MKNRFFAAFSLMFLALNFVGGVSAAPKKRIVKNSPPSRLVALLPPSDAIVTVDAKRFFNDALPNLLTANPTLMGRVTGAITEMQARSGIDLRQFDSLAAGIQIKKISAKEYDYDPVVIARGQMNAAGLVGAAKLASGGKYREEMTAGRTLYIFKPRDVVDQNKSKIADPAKAAIVQRVAGKIASEMALAVFDTNTVVIGSPARIREMFAVKTPVASELYEMLGRSEGAIMEFAAKVPEGASGLLPMENDELAKNINAIRYLYGNMGVSADGASVRATARTLQPARAQGLFDTLSGLQLLGKALLGSASGADKQVYSRMLNNLKLATAGNEVSLDLQVPQGDLDVLIARIK